MYYLNFKKTLSIILMIWVSLMTLDASEYRKDTDSKKSEQPKPSYQNKIQQKLDSKIGRWLIRKIKKKAARKKARLDRKRAKGKVIMHDAKPNYFHWALWVFLGSLLLGLIGF